MAITPNPRCVRVAATRLLALTTNSQSKHMSRASARQAVSHVSAKQVVWFAQPSRGAHISGVGMQVGAGE